MEALSLYEKLSEDIRTNALPLIQGASESEWQKARERQAWAKSKEEELLRGIKFDITENKI